ncbi:hypothetical protein [Sulfurovum riftiae]|uniref:Uncharacterized protein n=1 Tax=Sulfurovum riftiae TaxID=1630136 RepID=A0A151CGF7_9BACT|nr:hypothetical protein [Sulfurovum riftiae]KYJ86569.1 hypothetical protein AS592_07140 [Sulfurovum riftiae]
MNSNEQTIHLLQKHLPSILQREQYFYKMVVLIQSRYYFHVDEINLRKKLEKYLEASCCDDNVKIAQRLIGGKYDTGYEKDENWIWLGSREIAVLAQEAVENTKAQIC